MKKLNYLILCILLIGITAHAQKKPKDTDMPYVYLHQILGNETDTSKCTITPLSLPATQPYNIVCNVKLLQDNGSEKASYVNIFFANKKDTLLYNIHHTANLKIPPGTYTVFIQRKGVAFVNKEVKITSNNSYTIDLLLKPRPVVMDVKYACATKNDIKKLIKTLETPDKKIEEHCNCIHNGVVFYD